MSCIQFSVSGQSNTPDIPNNFYKSKKMLEQDENSFRHYKKSKRQKVAAISLGVVSIASIIGGVYIIDDLEPSGQSFGIFIVVSGLGAIETLNRIFSL